MRSNWLWLTILCWVPTWGAVAKGADPSAEDLIQGVLSRYDAVFSGRMKYRMSSGFPEDTTTKIFTYDLMFLNTSWRLAVRYPIADLDVVPMAGTDSVDPAYLSGVIQVATVSHGENFVEYKAVPELDGSVRHLARISAERPLRSNKLEAPPVFAGTFWFDCTRQFVQKNGAKAVKRPSVKSNGVLSHVLEWKVSKEQKYEAFHSTNDLTARGGILRIYISPELGYVLPRIECVGDQGIVAAAYDSSNFVECGDSKFLPRRSSLQYYTAKGRGFFLNYDILEVKGLNEQFSGKDFVLELPIGTSVSDARSGTHSTVFELKDDSSIPSDLVEVIQLPSWRFWRRTPTGALILGVIGGVAILLGAFFCWKKVASWRKKCV